MAKIKKTSEIVSEYFQGIKYFEEKDRLIVVLPEGLEQKKADLKDGVLKLESKVADLEDFTIIGNLKVPDEDVKEVLVLRATDAKAFNDWCFDL